MSIFDRWFKKGPTTNASEYFKLLNGYTPVFTSFNGSIYESELCRTSIDAIARHSSKLQVTMNGSARSALKTQLVKQPNSMQTWSQFLYRYATVLYTNNTAFVVPTFNRFGEVNGITAISPNSWELVQAQNGTPWVRFKFDNKSDVAFMLDEIGISTRFQNRSDLFGEDNKALRDTLDLIEIQRQGIQEAVKNSASYRFMAKINNFSKAEDLKRERKRFNEENFSGHADGGGILLFPNTYSDIKEVSQHTYNVDKDQIELIQTNVFNYFGVNLDVLQNKAYGDAFSAFYEGCLEVIAIQLSEVLTKMLYTARERADGNQIFFTANRMQYMTNADKLNVSAQMLDRGIMSINEVREIWNLPPIEDGDNHIIRGEYYSLDEKVQEDESNGNEE